MHSRRNYIRRIQLGHTEKLNLDQAVINWLILGSIDVAPLTF